MIRTLLIEDDVLNANLAIQILENYCPHLQFIGHEEDVENSIARIIHDKPDLILMDIELHDRNATEILNVIDLDSVHVILLTAHSKYAIPMYKYNISGYLLKPMQIHELLLAIEKIDFNQHSLTNTNQEFQLNKKQFLALPDRGFLTILKPEEIIYLEAQGNYTLFTSTNGKKTTCCKPIKDYESLLPDYLFVRVHQSHIVNIRYIEKYLKTKNGHLLMSDGKQIPISASKKDVIKSYILF